MCEGSLRRKDGAVEDALKKAVEEAKAVKLEEERARGREVSRWRVLQAHNSHFMLSHCRPPPTVGHGEFFAGHTGFGRLKAETVTVTNRRSSDYLSIFRVKNEVSVAKIESIILSIFRVNPIDYRFRFLE